MIRLETIRAKFLLYTAVLSIACFAVAALYVRHAVRTSFDKAAVRHVERHARVVASVLDAVAPSDFDSESTQGLAERLAEGDPGRLVAFAAADGSLIRYRGPTWMKERVAASLKGRAPTGFQQARLGRRMMVAIVPIVRQESHGVRGWLALGMMRDTESRETVRMLARLLVFPAALMLLLVALLWIVGTRLVRPMKKLQEGFRRFGHGDFAYRLAIDTRDEFASLGQQFNDMGEQLQTMMAQIERTQRDLTNQVEIRSRELLETNRKLQEAMVELRSSQQLTLQTEKQKSLTAVVSGFAHEINNPLTGIIGYLDLLALRSDITPPVREKLLSVQKQAQRIKNVIEQLNQLNPDIEQTKLEINVVNFLDKLVKVVSAKAGNQDIQFEKQLPPEGEIFVFGNHFALWQVFDGILENAVEAIKGTERADGRITVVFKPSLDRSQAIIEVIDNGGGVAQIEKAFDPFFTTKNRTEKKGIGLSIAYNIIQEHRGAIHIENNAGGGATVTVTMPISRQFQPDGNPRKETQC